MLTAILSPSKAMDHFPHEKIADVSVPRFQSEAYAIVKKLAKLSTDELCDLMSISDKIAALNRDRFHTFSLDPYANKPSPALLSYTGEVYSGLDAKSLSLSQLKQADRQLLILSAVYGILKPMDLVQAYRLELGQRNFQVQNNQNLYSFWKDKVALALLDYMQQNSSKILVNLASDEYFQVIKNAVDPSHVIHIHFREKKQGTEKLTFVSTNAKRARGLMAKYMIVNKVKTLTALKKFNLENYGFAPDYGDDNNLYFIR